MLGTERGWVVVKLQEGEIAGSLVRGCARVWVEGGRGEMGAFGYSSGYWRCAGSGLGTVAIVVRGLGPGLRSRDLLSLWTRSQ